MSILVQCIKETYTWDGDGEQHKFCNVKKDHVYTFDKGRDGIYWIDPILSANREDLVDKFGYFNGCARGLEEKYFKEMFRVL